MVTYREDEHGSTPRRPDIVGQTRRSPAAVHIAYLMRDMCQSKAGSGHVDRLFYRGAELERLNIFFSFRQPTILRNQSRTMLFTKYARTLNAGLFLIMATIDISMMLWSVSGHHCRGDCSYDLQVPEWKRAYMSVRHFAFPRQT